MKRLNTHALAGVTLGLLYAWGGAGMADTSLGPDPYQVGFGFDQPQEAEWGGWSREAEGVLYAEWDIFKDGSHGGAEDRTAAPDLGQAGVTSAWLGWNAGTFISSTMNLYSFSVPEIIRVNMAGTSATGPIRVALQVETQGDGSLDTKHLRLNGLGPAVVSQTFKGTYPSSMGPAELVHQLVLWDFAEAPDSFEIDFTAPMHTTIRQVAVDIGPRQGGASLPPKPAPLEKARVFINLPAEELDAGLTSSLFAQKRNYFPQVWPAKQLAFRQNLPKVGGVTRIKRRLSGSIKALYHDETTGGASNRLLIDIYHRDEIGDSKIAECELKPTQLRRWAKVLVDGREQRLGTAVYKLDVQSVGIEWQASTRLTKRLGQCDIDFNAEGIQPGVPFIQEGDYTTLRRVGR